MHMRTILAALLIAALAMPGHPLRANPPTKTEGEVRFEPSGQEAKLPERFRLKAHAFTYHEEAVAGKFSGIAASRVTFPSPVETKWACNNTVHCEYFRPLGKEDKKVPAVVVLHILGGDFPLARFCATSLANQGVGALFVKMPYYGPRRPADSPRRMVSPDPRETVEGMTQAVLDIRRAVAFLGDRPEVDDQRIGAFGISLGGITAALATSVEPRISRSCLLLAGGDIGRVAWESPELAEARKRWEATGGTREEFTRVLGEIDPAAYAALARDRKILMLNARHDEVIPRACTESLWEAFGKQEIVWYDGTHYTVARHLFDCLGRASRFLSAE